MNQRLSLVQTAPLDMSCALDTAPDFLVRSRHEITRVLEGMQAQDSPLAVSLPNATCTLASSLIFVDEGSGTLLLDCPPEWQTAIKAGADMVRLCCVFEEARIEFQSATCVLVDMDGTPVAGLPIPEFMWRFQRRRDQRQQVSGLTILLNMGFLEAEAQMLDLSTSGVGTLHCDCEVKFDNGELLRKCSIALPGVGQISVDLEVQNQHLVELPGGRAVTRVGCQMNGLSEHERRLIAQYLEALASD